MHNSEKIITFAERNLKGMGMNTITIDSNIYNDAAAYAQKHNTSVKDMVEKFLSKFKAAPQKIKKLKELPPELARLGGILKGVEDMDDGTDERFHYLMEKYK